MNIDLSTGTPASPGRTRHLAETFAELVRVMNHTTMDHAALGSPADAERVLREIETAVMRLPQLLSQVARWTALEDGAARIAVPSGEWAGRPHAAVTALQVRLDVARASAGAFRDDLKHAARVTSDLAGTEDRGGPAAPERLFREAAAEACTYCNARPGTPCRAAPDGFHLARFLGARSSREEANALSRAADGPFPGGIVMPPPTEETGG